MYLASNHNHVNQMNYFYNLFGYGSNWAPLSPPESLNGGNVYAVVDHRVSSRAQLLIDTNFNSQKNVYNDMNNSHGVLTPIGSEVAANRQARRAIVKTNNVYNDRKFTFK
jgi:hypothetical protein